MELVPKAEFRIFTLLQANAHFQLNVWGTLAFVVRSSAEVVKVTLKAPAGGGFE
jgi:hypothetical protein